MILFNYLNVCFPSKWQSEGNCFINSPAIPACIVKHTFDAMKGNMPAASPEYLILKSNYHY